MGIMIHLHMMLLGVIQVNIHTKHILITQLCWDTACLEKDCGLALGKDVVYLHDKRIQTRALVMQYQVILVLACGPNGMFVPNVAPIERHKPPVRQKSSRQKSLGA